MPVLYLGCFISRNFLFVLPVTMRHCFTWVFPVSSCFLFFKRNMASSDCLNPCQVSVFGKIYLFFSFLWYKNVQADSTGFFNAPCSYSFLFISNVVSCNSLKMCQVPGFQIICIYFVFCDIEMFKLCPLGLSLQELIIIDDLLSALVGIEGRYISTKKVQGKEDAVVFQADASMDLALQVRNLSFWLHFQYTRSTCYDNFSFYLRTTTEFRHG